MADRIDQALTLRERGLFLQAWHILGCPDVPVIRRTWTDLPYCLVGARLCDVWGQSQLAGRLHSRARRLAPDSNEVRLETAHALRQHRGPVACLESLAAPPAATDWQVLRAHALLDLNDRDGARRLLDEVAGPDTDSPRVTTAVARWHWVSDRRNEALSLARDVIERHPEYRPAAETLLYWLGELDARDEQAELIEQVNHRFEYPRFAAYGVVRAVQDNQPDLLARWSQRYRELTPLPGAHVERWLAGEAARLHLRQGQRTVARPFIAVAAQTSPFWANVAQRLDEAGDAGPPILLPVKAVRQRFLTCAPATLASLLDFIGHARSEEAIADAICFGGTRAVEQARYLRAQGLTTCEFRMTAASAIALLQSGMPFAVATQDFETGHLQAVVGFDKASALFTVRDPGTGYLYEVDARHFRLGQMASGPRALVVVDPARAAELQAMELPEAVAYVAYSHLEAALDRHDRDAAINHLSDLSAAPDSDRLVRMAEWAIAGFDGDRQGTLRAIDSLLALFPHDGWLHWCRLHSAAEQESFAQREQALHQATLASAHPNFLISLARFKMQDARQWDQAAHLLQRASKLRPVSALLFGARSDLAVRRRAHCEAAWLAKLASLQEPSSENAAWSVFETALASEQTEEALAWLRQRDLEARKKSRGPALTLISALERLDRDGSAQTLLDELTAEYSDDPDVVLRRIEQDMGTERNQESIRALQAWRRHPQGGRQLAQALIYSGDSPHAIEVLRERIEVEPLAVDLHGRLASALADVEGTAVAIDYLLGVRARFPHHQGILQLTCQWLGQDRPRESIALLEQALRQHPKNAWAWRELGFSALGQGRIDQAVQAAHQAAQIEPHASATFNLLGDVARHQIRYDDALSNWWQALATGGDQAYALEQSLELTPRELRSEFLERYWQIVGNAAEDETVLLSWLNRASPILATPRILELWQSRESRFGECWQWQTGLIRILMKLDATDAVRRAAAMTLDHANLPIAWVTRARAEMQQNREAALDSARQALALSATWDDAIILVAELCADLGRLDEADAVLVEASRRQPRNAALLGNRAELLMRRQDWPTVIKLLEQAIWLNEDYGWAWWQLDDLAPKKAEALALHLTERRPGAAQSWFRLGYVCADLNPERALIALDRALAINPKLVDAHSLKAHTLSRIGRSEEALVLLDQFDPERAHPTILTRRIRILCQGHQRHEALQELNQALKNRHDQLPLHRLRAELATDRQYHYLARQSLDALLQANPDDVWAARQLGWLLSTDGMDERAAEMFRTVLRQTPGDVDSWRKLIEFESDQDRAGAARDLLEQARQRVNDPWLDTMEVETLLKVKRHDDAVLSFRTLIAKPGTGELHLNYLRRRHAGIWPDLLDVAQETLLHPHEGTAIAEQLVMQRYAYCFGRLEQVLDRMQGGHTFGSDRAVVCTMLGHLGSDPNTEQFVVGLLHSHRSLFESDWLLRGQMGYCLITYRRTRMLRNLGHDWRTQGAMRGWIAANLSLAFLAGADRAESLAIREAAIRDDASWRGYHACFAWLDAYLLGRPTRQEWFELARTGADAPDNESRDCRLGMMLIRGCLDDNVSASLSDLHRNWPDNLIGRYYFLQINNRLIARLPAAKRIGWWIRSLNKWLRSPVGLFG